MPYDQWVREGVITATPGNVTDYDFIKEQVFQDAALFQVQGLAIDRWNATHLANQLQNEGVPVVLFGQGFASMGAPTKELERRVMGHGFDHGNNPVLSWMASNAAVTADSAGNIKPAKDRASEKIDGIVAMIMAIGLAEAHMPDVGTSFWEAA